MGSPDEDLRRRILCLEGRCDAFGLALLTVVRAAAAEGSLDEAIIFRLLSQLRSSASEDLREMQGDARDRQIGMIEAFNFMSDVDDTCQTPRLSLTVITGGKDDSDS